MATACNNHIYENITYYPAEENIYEEIIQNEPRDDVTYEEVQYSQGQSLNREDEDPELTNIYLEVWPRSEEEVQEMRDYVEAQKKSKFLFDGTNLIKIRPKRFSKLKALLGKAQLLRKRIKQNGSTKKNKKITGDPSIFNGTLAEYFQEVWIVPTLIDRITGNLELRDRVRSGTYMVKADAEEVRKVKEIFRRGKVPENISEMDDHILANAVLSFLSDLDDKVIPYEMRAIFVFAGQIEDMRDRVTALKNLIFQLPKINRMTLAALVNNAILINNRKVTMEMYAQVFGPLLIGFSCPEKDNDPDEQIEIYNTMLGLLTIEYGFYHQSGDVEYPHGNNSNMHISVDMGY